jgi:hypothetical protein
MTDFAKTEEAGGTYFFVFLNAYMDRFLVHCVYSCLSIAPLSTVAAVIPPV